MQFGIFHTVQFHESLTEKQALDNALEEILLAEQVDKLSIKNPLQKNTTGIAVYMNLHEINIGN